MMRGMRAALLDRRVVVTGGEETQRNWTGVIEEIDTIVMNQVVRVLELYLLCGILSLINIASAVCS